jgi:hypothetical protein
MGNVYQAVGKMMSNSSALFRILVPSSTHKNPMDGISMDGLRAAEAAVDAAMKPLSRACGSKLIQDEFANAAGMLRHACRIGMSKLDPTAIAPALVEEDVQRIIAEHHRLWLARNRPGGLEDSAGRLAAS